MVAIPAGSGVRPAGGLRGAHGEIVERLRPILERRAAERSPELRRLDEARLLTPG